MSLQHNPESVYGTGEVLSDGRTDWRKEKLRSTAVSEVMPTEKRQERMGECSTFLEFSVDSVGAKKLKRANFCKDRMCPACQRRRSLKVFHQIKRSCTALLQERPTAQFMMLTLTVPNVHKDDLDKTLKHMFKSWTRLIDRAEFKKAVLGWFRSLEITKEKRDRVDYYHPHFHVLIAVPAHYFKTKVYIKQSRWLELWQESTKQPEITQVDIRRVKSKNNDSENSDIKSAAAEVGKYATKPGDYIHKYEDSYIADESIVSVLSEVLKNKRIIAFGGALKSYLSDRENKDHEDDSSENLVHVGDDSPEIEAVMTRIFRWHSSHRNYIG